MGLLTIIKKQKRKDKELKCLILGLDNSGKSTLVNKLLPEEERSQVEITPTIGFQIVNFNHGGYTISMWDIGGQTTLRPFWDNYFDKMEALVWCVDVSAPSRFQESLRELSQLLNLDRTVESGETLPFKLIVVLNKIDLVDWNSVEGQLDSLLSTHLEGIEYVSLAVSALNGQGTMELATLLLP
ncbi:hypothetical protein NCAS_0D01240 [Naumovozyma castellii]|uniref:Uncharacterized protein n=1 Tax=Naumovozyma castellii TaxID=27288 RepID=G0VDR6_NAUCA|nr:hypothetical protein NCAS_0D01240 [Naumovozyma castellii CBS 4309]CCC69705.1 hypothetical protein NCAS_0D01240 [Naumovozyma castellii CBS 4309]